MSIAAVPFRSTRRLNGEGPFEDGVPAGVPQQTCAFRSQNLRRDCRGQLGVKRLLQSPAERFFVFPDGFVRMKQARQRDHADQPGRSVGEHLAHIRQICGDKTASQARASSRTEGLPLEKRGQNEYRGLSHQFRKSTLGNIAVQCYDVCAESFVHLIGQSPAESGVLAAASAAEIEPERNIQLLAGPEQPWNSLGPAQLARIENPDGITSGSGRFMEYGGGVARSDDVNPVDRDGVQFFYGPCLRRRQGKDGIQPLTVRTDALGQMGEVDELRRSEPWQEAITGICGNRSRAMDVSSQRWFAWMTSGLKTSTIRFSSRAKTVT